MLKAIEYIAAFSAGFAVMGLELLGFRVLAPYFGYSIYVSGALIGVVLAALSVGYMIGGRVADKYRRREILWGILLAASLFAFLGGLLHKAILGGFSGLSPSAGAIWGTIILYGPAMLLLSTVSPIVIKIMTREGAVGRTAGDVYGIATLGSIFGVFLTSFWLVPAIGATYTFYVIGIVLLVVGISGFATCRKYIAAAALLLCGVFFVPEAQAAQDESVKILEETETMYTRLAVVEHENGMRRLTSYRGRLTWSFTPDEGYLSGSVFDAFLLGPILNGSTKEVLVLGMGAGTSIEQMRHFFPQIEHIDAVEIDGEVVRMAEEYFGVKSDEKLSIHVADARTYLAKTTKKYDYIQIDLFHQGPYIPFYVATKEFFELVKSHLNPGGVMIYNVLADPEEGTEGLLFKPIANTVASVFPSTAWIPMWEIDVRHPNTNAVLVACASETGIETMRIAIADSYELGDFCAAYSRNISAVAKDSEIFSDDCADVESRNHALVARLMQRHIEAEAERSEQQEK